MELYTAPRHRRAIRTRHANFVGKLLAVAGTLAAAVALMTAAIGPAPAHAQGMSIPVEPRLAAVREAYLYARNETYWCARDGTVAAVRAGASTDSQVIRFVAPLCGPKMAAFMMAQGGYPEWDAKEHVALILKTGIDDAYLAMSPLAPPAQRKQKGLL